MKTIVYTSNTGHTEAYARILAEETGLPVLEWSQAVKQLPKGTPIIYMGWLFAGSVKGYQKAAKRFHICAVCGVGLCPTGELLDQVRKTIRLPGEIPLFTLQGGMDHSKLRGIYKYMIRMLIKMLEGKKDSTEADRQMLDMIKKGGYFICRENTESFLRWFRSAQK